MAIEESRQANAAVKVEIQALDAVKKDQDDGVIVTTFNDQHQVLKTQITELEVALAAAIEAKRVADLAAPWLAQKAVLVNANCACHGVARSATRFASIAAASVASNALA
jgi:tryptophan 2,3-dioxygenase